ncbi:dolichol kinase-like isoform X2 [Antedon mediterranea]|uniref:dolichol kinase-like isoform X2 n=1 Tax=Antedon mediterranea TaxID=105859 RepID=UPI003AF728D4
MMSLAVRELLVFSSSLFLLIDEDTFFRLIFLSVFVFACLAQYSITQKTFKSFGWAFRNEHNSGIVVGGMLVPITMLASTRIKSSLPIMYEDYQIASMLSVTVLLNLLIVIHNLGSVIAKKFVLFAWLLICLVSFLFWEGKRIYFANILLGILYFEGLVQYLPTSFTIGECLLVSQALALFTLDGCSRIVLLHSISPLYACLQVLVHGALVVCICFAIVLFILNDKGKNKKSEKHLKKLSASSHHWWRMIIFYAVTCSVVILVLFPVLSYLLGEFVILWGLKFVFETNIRILLIASWVILVLLASLIVYATESSSTIVRKYFHVIAVLIYVPGIMLDVEVTYLASTGALFIFILLEIIRVFRIEPFGSLLHEAFSVFVDKRDSGMVILTHIYLLLGFSIPVWLYQHVPSTQGLVLFSGVISLGIGDTAASVIGSKYGKHRWSAETVKTIEGTLAAVVTQLAACYVFSAISTTLDSQYSWTAMTAVVLLTSLLEAFTSQIDNLILPLFMSSMFCALKNIV